MEAITVKVSGALQQRAAVSEWQTQAATVAALLVEIGETQAALAGKILDDDGQLRPFVGLYINGQSLHALNGLATELRAPSEVLIIGSVAGG